MSEINTMPTQIANSETPSSDVAKNNKTKSIKTTPIRMAGRKIHFQSVTQTVFAQLAEEDIESTYKELRKQIDQYATIVAETLYDTPESQHAAIDNLQKAKELLVKQCNEDPAEVLSQAQFEVRNVHVAIVKKQQARSEERRLQIMVPGFVTIYAAMIIGTIIYFVRYGNPDQIIPVLNVPISIVVWAAIGSLAAILYRFYTSEPGYLASEIRWLFARPLIGIIMGTLAYMTIASGIYIFGGSVPAPRAVAISASDAVSPTITASATITDTSASQGNTTSEMPISDLEQPVETVALPEIPSSVPTSLLLIAFIGGFSDRFFHSVIHTVEGQFPIGTNTRNPSKNGSDESGDDGLV